MLGFLQLFGKIFFFTGYFSNSGSYPKPLPPTRKLGSLKRRRRETMRRAKS